MNFDLGTEKNKKYFVKNNVSALRSVWKIRVSCLQLNVKYVC